MRAFGCDPFMVSDGWCWFQHWQIHRCHRCTDRPKRMQHAWTYCPCVVFKCLLDLPVFIQIPSCFSKEFESIKNHLYFHGPQHDNPFLTSVTSFSTPLARTAKVPKADGCIDSCRMIAWFCQLAWQVWHEDCLWHHRWLQGLRDGWPMGYLAEHWQYRRCHRVFGCAF